MIDLIYHYVIAEHFKSIFPVLDLRLHSHQRCYYYVYQFWFYFLCPDIYFKMLSWVLLEIPKCPHILLNGNFLVDLPLILLSNAVVCQVHEQVLNLINVKLDWTEPDVALFKQPDF